MNGEDFQRSGVAGRRLAFGLLALLASLGCSSAAALASGAASKIVRFRGYRITVPRAWPVYDLTSDPTVCVRFNRHAVYLGRPSSAQRCPAHAVGRTEAILIEPLAARDSGTQGAAGSILPLPAGPDAQPRRGSAVRFPVAASGVIVTATWGSHPAIVARGLSIRSSAGLTASAASAPPPPPARMASARPAAGPGAVYAGLGFDACSAPSPGQMSAWGTSPYHAAGIYIGGTNMGCSQPNLSSAWVSQESAAGWHLIPTYVGLQAPSNSCGCAGIVPSHAAAEGASAASDAVTQARALGIGTGNPLYFDMEAYTPGGTSTSAVLTFLAAWTAHLHGAGYRSGVYSSAASGMVDLAANVGTGYVEPDDVWIADWNGAQTTNDPYVPGADWAVHQRLHQYNGGRNERYGGVTLNVDDNYLDGSTAAAGSAGNPPATVAPVPTLKVVPGVDGANRLYASWPGATGIQAWRVLAGASPQPLVPLGGVVGRAAQISIHVPNSFPYFAIEALGGGEQVLATSPAVPTPAHVAIYGHSAFPSVGGVAGLPVGCFTGSPCRIATTITTGATVMARTGPEFIPGGSGGLVYFQLSEAGRAMLARRHGAQLPVRVSVREASGVTATTTINLIPFVSAGAGPRRRVTQSPTLHIVGLTGFVSPRGVGGILAGCYAAAPCEVTTKITARGATVARTSPQFLGANELGYMFFNLTRQGRAMLAGARGNHLGAHVIITDTSAGAGATASAGSNAHADIALVRFG